MLKLTWLVTGIFLTLNGHFGLALLSTIIYIILEGFRNGKAEKYGK
jgi:hypothetical protein